jgi:hypothetical protein
MVQRCFLIFVFMVAITSLAIAQADQPQPDAANVPQVTFEVSWRAANPQWFQIAIDSTGRASYQSQAHTEPNETPGDPYELKFTASQKLRNEVFNVAKDLDFFKTDLSFTGKQKMASTGDKILSYTADGKTTKAKFDYSPHPKAQQLAKLFQQMSVTFELGRQLDYSLRFDKLGVDQKLKQLEDLERNHAAPGLQVLVPTLERVLNDPTSMNMSRQRASFLIYAAKSGK